MIHKEEIKLGDFEVNADTLRDSQIVQGSLNSFIVKNGQKLAYFTVNSDLIKCNFELRLCVYKRNFLFFKSCKKACLSISICQEEGRRVDLNLSTASSQQ